MKKILCALFVMVSLSPTCYGQSKLIRKIVYKNGQTEVAVNVKVSKFIIGKGYTSSVEFFPVDSCDCAKVGKVKFRPTYSGIYEAKEVLCNEITETILISANGEYASTRQPDWASSFAGPTFLGAIPTFKKDARADSALLRILTPVGLANIINEERIVIEAAPIENAQAAIIKGKRYIFYNPDIIKKINRDDWASIGIFAHELAHHIFFQDIESKSRSEEFRALELEADEWAGYMLGHLNCPKDSANKLTRFILHEAETETHPAKAEREKKVMLGWRRGIEAKRNGQINKLYIENFANGKSRFEKAKYQEALTDFDQAITNNQWFKDAYLYRGMAHAKLNQLPQAISDLSKFISMDTTNAEAFQYRAFAYAFLNNLDLAEKDIQFAIKKGANTSRTYYVQGLIFGGRQKPQDAIAMLNKAIELDSSFAPPYYFRGSAYYNLGNLPKALEDFDNSIRKSEAKNLQYYYWRGFTKFMLKNLEGALADYRVCIEIDPQNTLAVFQIAYTYASLMKYKDAVTWYTRVLELDPNNTMARLNRAMCNMSLFLPAEAVTDLDLLVNNDAANLNALFWKSKAHQQLKNFAIAMAGFDKLVQLNPMDFNFLARGYCLMDMGEFDRAFADFQQAYQLNAFNLDALSGLAMAKTSLNKLTEALQDYNKLIALNPIGMNYFNRAICLNKAGKNKEALKDFNKADSLSKDMASIKYWKAFVKMALAYKPKEMLPDIDKAIALDSQAGITNVEYFFLRASIYEIAKNKEKACSDYLYIESQPPKPVVTEQARKNREKLKCN